MNERLREEMDYCGPRGIPHSTFLGRLARPGEPVWTAHDREIALAWARNQRQICGGCGTRAEEWDETQGGDRFRYVAWSDRCPGCEVLAQEQEQLPENAKGMKVYLVPRAVGEQLMAGMTGWGGEYTPRPDDPPGQRKGLL